MAICQVCRALLIQWADAQRALLMAEERLTADRGADSIDVQMLTILIQEARLECDQARLGFENHRRDHDRRN